MYHLTRRARICCIAAAFLLAAAPVVAALKPSPKAITRTEKAGRIYFKFDRPAKLVTRVSPGKLVLKFNGPVRTTPAVIEQRLEGYVSTASISPDQQTITLSLLHPYPVRQLSKGNNISVELLGAPQTLTLAEARAAASIEPTAGGDTPRAATESAIKTIAPAETRAATEEMLTTKPLKPDEATTPPPENAAAVETPPAPAEPMLTTKPAPTAEVSTTPAPERPAPKVIAVSPPVTAPPTGAPPAEVATPTTTAPAPKTEQKPFLVTTRTRGAETTLTFPWEERTAAAIYKRGRDIWVVFSASRDLNVSLFRGSLPKQVINTVQYSYKNATVLRLITDGNLQPRINQVKGTYGWNLILAKTGDTASQNIQVSADGLEGTMRLILAAYDVTTPIKFYDPSVGDLVIVIPAYEVGRAIDNTRNFPEFSVLSTVQGIAISSKRNDLQITTGRSGVIVNAPGGLSISDNLPKAAAVTTGKISGVMMPYNQWYIPKEKFLDILYARIHNLSTATKATKADALFDLVRLYLTHGQCADTLGILKIIREEYPNYYINNKLAMLNGACNALTQHYAEAAGDLTAPELNEMQEADLWREVVSLNLPQPDNEQNIQQLLTPGTDSTNNLVAQAGPTQPPQMGPFLPTSMTMPKPKPVFHFLKYNKLFIRHYPPTIRQKLATIAADAYLESAQEEKALAAFDTLIRDGIAEPVALDAEYVLGRTAQKKGQFDQAYEIYDRLGAQNKNRYIAARARYSAALLRLELAKIKPEEAAEIIENVRFSWHGDALERDMLNSLLSIYEGLKRYDDVLRTQKAMLEAFPNAPDALKRSAEMGELFQRVFLSDLADDMPPLKALSLFYEFRELTPLGETGDQMIQRLADRLAALDLLDRATQLLEHQIRYRTTGVVRSQVGARLALLHLLNHHPQEALKVLEVTNYGGNTPELQIQRAELTAEALMKLGKHQEALGMLHNDTTKMGQTLRLDILWAMQDWPNVVNQAEDILNARPNLTDPLTTDETSALLKLALGYTFEGDYTQLRYLRDYYGNLIPDSGYKQIFDFLTNDTTPLDPEDFAMVNSQIGRTEGFLDLFKKKIVASKLSDVIK